MLNDSDSLHHLIMFIKDIDSTYTAATHFNPNPYILIVIWFIENLFVCTNKS